jgi:hypothetical protein
MHSAVEQRLQARRAQAPNARSMVMLIKMSRFLSAEACAGVCSSA